MESAHAPCEADPAASIETRLWHSLPLCRQGKSNWIDRRYAPAGNTAPNCVVRQKPFVATARPIARAGRRPMTVKAILSRKGTNVVTADPNASLGEAVKTLAAHRIGAIVVTGADRRIVGILAERDIVRVLA